MATIDVQPIVLRDVLLNIPTDDYSKHVSAVTITPSSGTVNFTGLNPDATFTFPTATTWSVQLDYAQDWETTNSLSLYLFENEGEQVEMTFEPKAGGLGWTVDVFIAAGAIGGAVNQVATASVTLGVVGRPTPVPVVPAG